LKYNGVYDNTRIILVSDHGPAPSFSIKSDLPFNIEQFNALLMVKDFYANGILKTNTEFMTNADVPSLAMEGLIENAVNPFTGNQINMKAKEKPLYIAVSGSIHLQNKQTTQFSLNKENDYYVHKNIFDTKNWIPAKNMQDIGQ
ncbi:MAG: hypothetical protein FWH41_09885, partial [Treponema sp.]|nr:hypothetical protein [Treponema sp.]